MKRLIIGFLLGGVLGAAVGLAFGIFIYTYWFPPPAGMEQVANLESKRVVATGQFIHVNTSDPVHWGRGGVTLYEGTDGVRLAFLERDFEVGPGPRFHVYLVDRAQVRSGDDFKSSEMVDLGPLRTFVGSQNYSIPASVDLAKYNSVVIWCKQFNVLISPATLVKKG